LFDNEPGEFRLRIARGNGLTSGRKRLPDQRFFQDYFFNTKTGNQFVNGRLFSLILLSTTLLMMIIITGSRQSTEGLNQDIVSSGVSSANVDSANVDSANVEQSLSLQSQAREAISPSGDAGAESNPLSGESPPNTPAALLGAQPEIGRFYTIGSVGENSPYRYLITVNPVGGTIRRVELNFRRKDRERYKYRDMEYTGGYLGCLDPLDTPRGVMVRSVGSGTPASLARAPGTSGGIQPGDFLKALDDEPITSAEEFEDWLKNRTKPNSTIRLTVERPQNEASDSLNFEVQLTHKPIELTGPEVHPYFPELVFPESFILSLLKPTGILNESWPELDVTMRTARWQVTQVSDSELELTHSLNEQNLAVHNYQGLTAFKRIRIPVVSAEERHKFDTRTFHYELELGIDNRSDNPQTVTYQLDGPTGSTTEAWWYTHKTHGRQSAVGYTAGTRDVTGSTAYESFIFKGCPEITQGATAKRPFPQFICNPAITNPAARELNFVGVDTLYFNTSLIPRRMERAPFEVNSVTAFPSGPVAAAGNSKYTRLTDCTFQLFKTVELEAGESYRQSFDIFCGPKDKTLLTQYGLDDVRVFGWFAAFSKPLMALLHFFYWVTGGFSYGLAIIMLTVLVRTFMIPVSRKAALNAQMMQYLQPQMQEIRDKYKNDMEKVGVAQRELFKKYNYNPFSGCLMLFLQLPIFFGLFRGLSVDIALRDQPLIPGIDWCKNLAAPDKLWMWKDWMPKFLADELGFLGPYLNILPLITVVLFLVQQKMFMPPPTDDQQRLMQKMMTYMMVFMGVLFFKVPAGLCVYFITSSIWGIIERKMLPKPVLNTEKLAGSTPGDAATSAASAGGFGLKYLMGKGTNGSSDSPVSREAQLAERKQRNLDRQKRLKKKNR
jgi:YidC/Oxa1 family membrane protein insertase